MNFNVLSGKYAIYKFALGSALPEQICSGDFYSITRTTDEISVVACQSDLIYGYLDCNKDWCIIRIEGLLDFSLVGIIADISAIFKKKNISIFTISTYNTDYFLIKQKDLDTGIQALIENKHNVL
jgi:uncharacterized protein